MLSREELEELRKRAFASIGTPPNPSENELSEADKERIKAQLIIDAAEVKEWKKAGRRYALKRNEVQSYTKEQLGWRENKELDINEENVIEKAFEEVETTQPLQTNIEWKFESVNAPSIIKFLNYQNEKRGYAYRLDFKMHGKQAKRLVDIYGEESVKQALIKAAHSAKSEEGKNNFIGFKYVEGILSRQLKESMK